MWKAARCVSVCSFCCGGVCGDGRCGDDGDGDSVVGVVAVATVVGLAVVVVVTTTSAVLLLALVCGKAVINSDTILWGYGIYFGIHTPGK